MVLALSLHPGFELPDGFTLHRQLDVGVEGIDFLARGVTHEGLPHVLHDTRFHKPGVEGVAKIVKAGITDTCSSDRRLPGGFDLVDRTALKGEDQTFRFLTGKRDEEFREPSRERDFAGLAARSFRVSDEEHATGKVDVLHELGEQFSAAHSRIERRDNKLPQMRRGGIEKLRFFREA